MCGAGGDAGCDAGLVGAPGAPLWRVGLRLGAGARGCVLCWGLPAGRCRLLCVVFPVLGVCAATYSVHAL